MQIRRKGFPSESATFRLKAQADAWAIERECELVGSRHGIIPRRTVRQAVTRYMADECPKHRGERWERVRLAKILRNLEFADRDLQSVTKDDIAKWRDAMTLAPSRPERLRHSSIPTSSMRSRAFRALHSLHASTTRLYPANCPRSGLRRSSKCSKVAASFGKRTPLACDQPRRMLPLQ